MSEKPNPGTPVKEDLYKLLLDEIAIELTAAKSLAYLGVLCLNLNMPRAAQFFFSKAVEDISEHSSYYEGMYKTVTTCESMELSTKKTASLETVVYPHKLNGIAITKPTQILEIIQEFYKLESNALIRIDAMVNAASQLDPIHKSIIPQLDILTEEHAKESKDASILLSNAIDLLSQDHPIKEIDKLFNLEKNRN